MTQRKIKRLILQLSLFFVTVLIIYLTYGDKNKKVQNQSKNNEKKEEKIADRDKKEESLNYFENVEYSGIDLNGNRYIIRSKEADFNIEKPELINMRIMQAIFYLKDGSIVTVSGDEGNYNNQTYDMQFRNNIVVNNKEDNLYGDNLDYFNSKGLLTISGNVRSESVKGNIVADKLKFDLNNKTMNASMFGNNQVRVGINKK